MRWGFFIDANLEPRTAEFLRKEGYSAEYSDYVLDEDANDTDDILPYVRQEELMIVTADIKNFAPLADSQHEGLLLVSTPRWRPRRELPAGADGEVGTPEVAKNT